MAQDNKGKISYFNENTQTESIATQSSYGAKILYYLYTHPADRYKLLNGLVLANGSSDVVIDENLRAALNLSQEEANLLTRKMTQHATYQSFISDPEIAPIARRWQRGISNAVQTKSRSVAPVSPDALARLKKLAQGSLITAEEVEQLAQRVSSLSVDANGIRFGRNSAEMVAEIIESTKKHPGMYYDIQRFLKKEGAYIHFSMDTGRSAQLNADGFADYNGNIQSKNNVYDSDTVPHEMSHRSRPPEFYQIKNRILNRFIDEAESLTINWQMDPFHRKNGIISGVIDKHVSALRKQYPNLSEAELIHKAQPHIRRDFIEIMLSPREKLPTLLQSKGIPCRPVALFVLNAYLKDWRTYYTGYYRLRPTSCTAQELEQANAYLRQVYGQEITISGDFVSEINIISAETSGARNPLSKDRCVIQEDLVHNAANERCFRVEFRSQAEADAFLKRNGLTALESGVSPTDRFCHYVVISEKNLAAAGKTPPFDLNKAGWFDSVQPDGARLYGEPLTAEQADQFKKYAKSIGLSEDAFSLRAHPTKNGRYSLIVTSQAFDALSENQAITSALKKPPVSATKLPQLPKTAQNEQFMRLYREMEMMAIKEPTSFLEAEEFSHLRDAHERLLSKANPNLSPEALQAEAIKRAQGTYLSLLLSNAEEQQKILAQLGLENAPIKYAIQGIQQELTQNFGLDIGKIDPQTREAMQDAMRQQYGKHCTFGSGYQPDRFNFSPTQVDFSVAHRTPNKDYLLPIDKKTYNKMTMVFENKGIPFQIVEHEGTSYFQLSPEAYAAYEASSTFSQKHPVFPDHKWKVESVDGRFQYVYPDTFDEAGKAKATARLEKLGEKGVTFEPVAGSPGKYKAVVKNAQYMEQFNNFSYGPSAGYLSKEIEPTPVAREQFEASLSETNARTTAAHDAAKPAEGKPAESSLEAKPVEVKPSAEAGATTESKPVSEAKSAAGKPVPGQKGSITAENFKPVQPSVFSKTANSGLMVFGAGAEFYMGYQGVRNGNIGDALLHTTTGLGFGAGAAAPFTKGMTSFFLGTAGNLAGTAVFGYEALYAAKHHNYVDTAVMFAGTAGTTYFTFAGAASLNAAQMGLGGYAAAVGVSAAIGWSIGKPFGDAFVRAMNDQIDFPEGVKLAQKDYDISGLPPYLQVGYIQGYCDCFNNAKEYNHATIQKGMRSREVQANIVNQIAKGEYYTYKNKSYRSGGEWSFQLEEIKTAGLSPQETYEAGISGSYGENTGGRANLFLVIEGLRRGAKPNGFNFKNQEAYRVHPGSQGRVSGLFSKLPTCDANKYFPQDLKRDPEIDYTLTVQYLLSQGVGYTADDLDAQILNGHSGALATMMLSVRQADGTLRQACQITQNSAGEPQLDFVSPKEGEDYLLPKEMRTEENMNNLLRRAVTTKNVSAEMLFTITESINHDGNFKISEDVLVPLLTHPEDFLSENITDKQTEAASITLNLCGAPEIGHRFDRWEITGNVIDAVAQMDPIYQQAFVTYAAHHHLLNGDLAPHFQKLIDGMPPELRQATDEYLKSQGDAVDQLPPQTEELSSKQPDEHGDEQTVTDQNAQTQTTDHSENPTTTAEAQADTRSGEEVDNEEGEIYIPEPDTDHEVTPKSATRSEKASDSSAEQQAAEPTETHSEAPAATLAAQAQDTAARDVAQADTSSPETSQEKPENQTGKTEDHPQATPQEVAAKLAHPDFAAGELGDMAQDIETFTNACADSSVFESCANNPQIVYSFLTHFDKLLADGKEIPKEQLELIQKICALHPEYAAGVRDYLSGCANTQALETRLALSPATEPTCTTALAQTEDKSAGAPKQSILARRGLGTPVNLNERKVPSRDTSRTV